MLTEEEKKERHRIANKKYYATEKGRAKRQEYLQSERGKAVMQSCRETRKRAEYDKKYREKEGVKERCREQCRVRRQRLRKTEEGREKRNSERKRLYRRSVKHAVNSRKSWTPEEVELILKHDVTDFELSKEIGRSVQAIQAKRAKLKADGYL